MKVGVLGAGSMGGTVIEHLGKCPQVKEIVAQDIRLERVQKLKEQYGIKAYTDLERILSDSEVKLVFITASNATIPLTRLLIL